MGKAGTVIAAFLVFAAIGAPSAAASQTSFGKCDDLHAVYKYGISKDKKAQARAVREGMHKPPVKPKVYADSSGNLDRDKDGTMCEVPK